MWAAFLAGLMGTVAGTTSTVVGLIAGAAAGAVFAYMCGSAHHTRKRPHMIAHTTHGAPLAPCFSSVGWLVVLADHPS